jgi:ABC-type antimicrobial peptide transport system permease subunit
MFGVIAYLVQQRTSEIGTRLVLGARPTQILWLVLLTSTRPVLIGLALGLAASAAASILLRSHLFGVGILDPVTYLAVTLIVLLAAMAASFWPARVAMSVSPIRALRCE